MSYVDNLWSFGHSQANALSIMLDAEASLQAQWGLTLGAESKQILKVRGHDGPEL
jgi:hypothetical protein